MAVYPMAWIFFVPFILISSFMVLNLFIAIIVSATQEVHESEQRAERDANNQIAHDERQEMLDLMRTMHEKIASLETALQKKSDQ
jgi:voltage-gated sodium channel